MSKRKKQHYPRLEQLLREYCEARTLDFNKYSPFHMRIMDGGYTVFDAWTTGRYYILTTDYFGLNPQKKIPERGGEKGVLPLDEETLFAWLDKLFYATEM